MPDAAWIALSLINGIGGRTLNALVDVFGSPEAVLEATPRQLQAIKGVGPKISAAVKAIDLPRVANDIARWESAGVRVLEWNDPGFPAALRSLADAPPTLFVRGCWPCLAPGAAAIVGTRTPTPAAREAAGFLAHQCVKAGVTVVSGLALGIDTAAHKEAIASPRAVTVAVLGSGVLDIYPTENRELAAAVMQRGALLCEVHPGARVSTTGLVARNRLVSGLADALVVVQTDADGGALHAARFAKAQGKRVYVIDDPLGNPEAQRGIDLLLADGAMPLSPDITGAWWEK